MKKTLLLILSVLLIVTFTNTQAQTKISFGGRAGLSFSNLSFDPDIPSNVTKSSRTGFKFGALAEIGFIPMLAVQIEPMYATGGAQLSGPLYSNGFNSVSGNITYKLSYLEIPILLKVKIPIEKSNIIPYAFLGPNIAFVLSSKELDEPNGYASNEINLKDQTSSINFALDFGAGAGFSVNKQTTIMLDVRYSLGLANLLTDKGKQASGYNSVKTTGFQIVAGVMFGL